MARALFALLLLALAGTAPGREPDALAALDACAPRLDPRLDVGYARIAARCPDLTGTLERSPWAAWLPAGWNDPHNELSATGLRSLRVALEREVAAVPGTRALHPERVHAVLERVTRPERGEDGWWARLKRWLRALLTPQREEDSHWWRRLLGDVSVDRATLRAIAALSVALLIALAVAVVMNELRVAGVLRRPAGAAGRPGAGGAAGGGLDLRDLDGAGPSDQPGLLLELVAARLAAQDRLPPARAFTVRELAARARLRDEVERLRLADLAAVSERVRYAAGSVDTPTLEAALRGGRQLLAALDAAAPLKAA